MKINRDHKHLEAFDPHSLLIGAQRYYQGRATIAAASFAQELANAWPRLPENTRVVIRRDLEEAFADDDKARAEGGQFKPLGWDCDRQAWEQVRHAWQREGES